jgi:SpoIID/LytB domain protein
MPAPARISRHWFAWSVALLAATAAGSSPRAASLAGVFERAAASGSSLPRVTFVAGRGGSVLVHGAYPTVHTRCVRRIQPTLHARFPGSIEIGKAADGTLFVIGEMPFEDYLKGLAEMPRTWPREALKAQAVAARSYALAHLRYPDPTGQALGYQLCATDACQVYLGMGVSDGPYGKRWRSAVNATAGRVLVYKGRPADTLYFSTSNGHTVGNEEVFGTAPLPYLRPVAERDDGASPLSHWRATISLADVTRFLRAAGAWSRGRVTSARTSGSEVVLTSSASPHRRTISVSAFRNDLNQWGPCLDPDSYPGTNGDNGTRLPQAVPSRWFTMSSSHGEATLEGRGWGHGVGMVQWGAYGKARRGRSYQQILADYYGGLTPRHSDEPATIRIGIATGLSAVGVAATRPVTTEGTTVAQGPWSITGGKHLRVRRGSPPPTYIQAGTLRGPRRARGGRRLRATVSLPQLSVVKLALVAHRTELDITPSRTFQAGTYRLTASVPADTVTGTYRLEAFVTNGTDIVHTKGRRIRVLGLAPSPTPTASSVPSPSPSATARPAALGPPAGRAWRRVALVAAGTVLVLLAAGALFIVRRKRPSRPLSTRGGDPPSS